MFEYQKNRYTVVYLNGRAVLCDADGFTVRDATANEIKKWESSRFVQALGYIEINKRGLTKRAADSLPALSN